MDTPLDAHKIRHLYAQRHEIIRFQRIAGLMKDVTWKLATTQLPGIDEPVRPFFRDVWDHVQRAEFRLTGLRDIAAGVVETNGLLEQRSEEHTSELQSLMRISYAVFCLKKKNTPK